MKDRFTLDLAVFIKERRQVNWEEIRVHFKCGDDILNFHLTQLIAYGFIKEIGEDTIPASYPIFEYIPLQEEAED